MGKSWLGTTHDVDVQFSLNPHSNWILLTGMVVTGMVVFAMLRRQPRLQVVVAESSRRRTVPRSISPSRGPRRFRLLRGTFFGIFLSAAALSNEISEIENARRKLDEGEDEEDPSLIQGARTAVLDLTWPDVHGSLMAVDMDDQVEVGSVQLGGVDWPVRVRMRDEGKLVGFYLTHRDGSKDQIAFSIKIIDVSDPRNHQLLAENRFGGDWVIIRFRILALLASVKEIA